MIRNAMEQASTNEPITIYNVGIQACSILCSIRVVCSDHVWFTVRISLLRGNARAQQIVSLDQRSETLDIVR